MKYTEHADIIESIEFNLERFKGQIPFPVKSWPLFLKALENIAAEPRRLFMPLWIVRNLHRPQTDVTFGIVRGRPGPDVVEEVVDRVGSIPPCNTVACLAGHIRLAKNPNVRTASTVSALMDLGLSTFRASWAADFVDPVSDRLETLFGLTEIVTYEQLVYALERLFTFPGPLPTAQPGHLIEPAPAPGAEGTR